MAVFPLTKNSFLFHGSYSVYTVRKQIKLLSFPSPRKPWFILKATNNATKKIILISQTWSFTSVISAQRRLGQEDGRFDARLGYTAVTGQPGLYKTLSPERKRKQNN
jgi:hypothetical protein